ncbi:DUF4136 domain-containing protein [Candidatus Binatia bacterium]|nr:DUF4136 domain-containing protein [Candidatus Binatia bacterium]
MGSGRILLLLLVAAIGGCGLSDLESATLPGTDLRQLKTAYVACHVADDGNLCALIARQLDKHGVTATTGIALPAPGDANVLVTYDDTWTWDVTSYLLTLRIDLRDPATNLLLATSRVSRTRFGSGGPDTMVREAVAQLLATRG